jgi:RNA polymerase sigma-70 factor (ECF subfamily)
MTRSNIRPLLPSYADDSAILAGIREGRESSYNLLYLKYAHRVHWLARGYLGDAEMARDALQETFMRIFDRVHAFKGETGLGKWIYVIAKNVCLDEIKRPCRQRLSYVPSEELDGLEVDGGASSDALVERLEITDRVNGIIERLEPKKRMTFLLHYVDDLTADEIGEIMGEGRGTVLKRLKRIRSELMERIRRAGLTGHHERRAGAQEPEKE